MEGDKKEQKEFHFVVPSKQISNQGDVRLFHQSNAYRILLDWIKALNTSVWKKPNSTECLESDVRKSYNVDTLFTLYA